MASDEPLSEDELAFRAVLDEYCNAPQWKRPRTRYALWAAKVRKDWTTRIACAKPSKDAESRQQGKAARRPKPKETR